MDINVAQFGHVQIFRPSDRIEAAVRQGAKTHLMARFGPGEYRGAESANAVIQHQFQFYDSLLQSLIPKIACREIAAFLLSEFDKVAWLLHGSGISDPRLRQIWLATEPAFRRALKYLIELICVQSSKPGGATTKPIETLDPLETALVCAESTMIFAQKSDLVCSVFPDDCIVRVYGDGPLDWDIRIEGKHDGFDQAYMERVVRDRQYRSRFVGSPQFDLQTGKHREYLDQAFSESFGMSYGLFVDCIATVFAKASPSSDPNALSAVFISRGQVMDVLAKLGRSRAGAERAIDGFSITAAHLLAEGGVVSKAKQENRAYRRAFFVFPHESGAELAFSREMARENIIQLVNGVCYKELSAEWTTSATRIALDHLSNAAGDWFEEVVLRNLKTLGIVGRRRQSTIGETGRSVQIPDSVGELDFFGFHPQQRLLVLVDYKMVMSGVDPSDWRDDLDRFVLGPDSYAERFRRKLAWVKENLPAIAASLGCPAATRLGAAMLTLYPCIAGTVIHDFPCVSVTEFMLDYQENSQWPYQRA